MLLLTDTWCSYDLPIDGLQIWIHVPFDRVDKTTNQKRPMLRVIIEKKSMVNLVRLLDELDFLCAS